MKELWAFLNWFFGGIAAWVLRRKLIYEMNQRIRRGLCDIIAIEIYNEKYQLDLPYPAEYRIEGKELKELKAMLQRNPGMLGTKWYEQVRQRILYLAIRSKSRKISDVENILEGLQCLPLLDLSPGQYADYKGSMLMELSLGLDSIIREAQRMREIFPLLRRLRREDYSLKQQAPVLHALFWRETDRRKDGEEEEAESVWAERVLRICFDWDEEKLMEYADDGRIVHALDILLGQARDEKEVSELLGEHEYLLVNMGNIGEMAKSRILHKLYSICEKEICAQRPNPMAVKTIVCENYLENNPELMRAAMRVWLDYAKGKKDEMSEMIRVCSQTDAEILNRLLLEKIGAGNIPENIYELYLFENSSHLPDEVLLPALQQFKQIVHGVFVKEELFSKTHSEIWSFWKKVVALVEARRYKSEKLHEWVFRQNEILQEKSLELAQKTLQSNDPTALLCVLESEFWPELSAKVDGVGGRIVEAVKQLPRWEDMLDAVRRLPSLKDEIRPQACAAMRADTWLMGQGHELYCVAGEFGLPELQRVAQENIFNGDL